MPINLSTGRIHFKNPNTEDYITLNTIEQPTIAELKEQIMTEILNETLPTLKQELDDYTDSKINEINEAQGLNSLKQGISGFTSGVFAGGGYDLLVTIPTGIQLTQSYYIGADDYQSSYENTIKTIIPTFEFSPMIKGNTNARIGNDSQGAIRLYILNNNNTKTFDNQHLIRIVRIDMNTIGMITIRLEIFEGNTKVQWAKSNLTTHSIGEIGTNVFGYFHIVLNPERLIS